MPSLADSMRDIDASIYAAIGETAIIGGVEYPGIFKRQYREVAVGDEIVEGVAMTFDTHYTAQIGALVEGMTIDVRVVEGSSERYMFIRRTPNRGDETGRVTLELGTP